MMPCTLPMRQMCLKAVCPFLISLSLMMRILANAKCVSLLVKVTPTSRCGKDKLISNGMTGLQERDNVVNDYADGGKRKPKNPNFFGPLSLIWRNVEFLSCYPPCDESFGVMSFLPHRSNDRIYAYTSETAG